MKVANGRNIKQRRWPVPVPQERKKTITGALVESGSYLG